MSVNRADLLESLGMVAPALATNDLIPIMTHIWFMRDKIMAFNDQIGIQAPFASGFDGALPGSLLINLLRASKAKEVAFEDGKDVLTIKAASARIKLAWMPSETFSFFEMPGKGKSTALLSSDDYRAFGHCLLSTSNDTSTPEYLGITLVPASSEQVFYSTNGQTLSRARTKTQFTDKRVIVSAVFCEQMLRIAKTQGIRLEITKNHVMACGDKGVILFGRLIASEKPLPFKEHMDNAFPPEGRKKAIQIPTKILGMLDRALTVLAVDPEAKVLTTISITGDKMRFVSTTAQGHEVIDSTQIEKHPEITAKVNAKMMKAGLPASLETARMLLSERCFAIIDGERLHLIAAAASE